MLRKVERVSKRKMLVFDRYRLLRGETVSQHGKTPDFKNMFQHYTGLRKAGGLVIGSYLPSLGDVFDASYLAKTLIPLHRVLKST